MANKITKNIWEDLCDTRAEVANMTARSDLMMALQKRVRSWGISQKAAAEKLGITGPRINDLLQGKISRFSLDALVNLTAAAGMKLQFKVFVPSPTRKKAKAQRTEAPGRKTIAA